MRLISLRKFRDSIADIDEPVEVARRDPDGTIRIIGVWTPGIADLSSPREGLVRSAAPSREWPADPPPIIPQEEWDKARFNSQPFRGPIPKKR